MGSDVGFHDARSKSKPNYQQAFKTQAHIGSGVVLTECILRPLATASKSTQTGPTLDHVKSLKDKEKKSLALKKLAFNKTFSIEQVSYPKDMYVKVRGTRERASIRVLGYMYIIYIREYIYDGNVLVSVPFS